MLSDLDVILGLDCTPITVVGVGSKGSTDVCCEDNNVVRMDYFFITSSLILSFQNDLISVGCVPIVI